MTFILIIFSKNIQKKCMVHEHGKKTGSLRKFGTLKIEMKIHKIFY